MQDDVAFFSNASKDDRERWILEHWCALNGHDASRAVKGEAPDFTVDDVSIEIVEVLGKGRRRHQEYKDDLKSATFRTHQRLNST